MKKLITGVLTACLFSQAYICADNEPQDKYTEWCHNLNLTPEQSEKIAQYLDDCKESCQKLENKSSQEKLQELLEAASSNEAETSELFQKAQALVKEDPVLAIPLIQLFCLSGLEASYSLFTEQHTTRNDNDGDFAEKLTQEEPEDTRLCEALEKSIDSCRLCSKLPRRKDQ